MRDALLIIHILAAGAWIGTNVVQAVINPRVATAGHEVAGHWWRKTVEFGTRIYTPAAVVILITGIFLVTGSGAAYSFGSAFVTVGFTAVILGAFLGIAVFGPAGRAIAVAYDAGKEPIRAVRRVLAFGILDTLVIVTAVVAMVMKWGV